MEIHDKLMNLFLSFIQSIVLIKDSSTNLFKLHLAQGYIFTTI